MAIKIAMWIGAALALGGLGGLGWCIREALRVKRSGMSPEEARKIFARLQVVNFASVGIAFFGLAAVAVAVILS